MAGAAIFWSKRPGRPQTVRSVRVLVLRLLPLSNREKDVEILALRH